MSDLRLKLPAAALEPELARYFDTVDAAAPAPMRPADGEDAIEAGALELGEGVRFLPLHVAEDASAAFIAAIVTASLIAGVGAGALTIAAGFDVTTVALAILAAVATVLGAGIGLHARRHGGGRGGPMTAHTGVLLTPQALVIRRARDVHVIGRERIATIEERMWEQPGGENSPPYTHYQGLVIVEGPQGRRELALVEVAVRGEAGLSLRASHPEGRFVGELVRHLVRRWLRAEPLER